MGEHVIGRTVQTNRKLRYQPGADVCSCFKCSIFTSERPCFKTNGISDWEIEDSDKSCCGGLCRPQPVCVHPDRDECFIGLDENNQNPLINIEWDRNAPNLKCVYNLDRVNTRAQVQAFTDKFGMNNDIEARYCTQRVKTCPDGLKDCSRLISTGEGGDECRKWFQKQNDNVKDSTIQNYCLRHDTEDCKCVNRAMKDSYRNMKGAKGINDGCWYIPCANPSRYLVPSHLKNPKCPENMCNVLFDFIKTGNVSFNDVKTDVNCTFKTPPTPSPIVPPVPPVPIDPTPSPIPIFPPIAPPVRPSLIIPESFFKMYWKELTSLLGVSILLYMVLRK